MATSGGARAIRRAGMLLLLALLCALPLVGITVVLDDWLLSLDQGWAKLWLIVAMLMAMGAVAVGSYALYVIKDSREDVIACFEGRPLVQRLLGAGLLIAGTVIVVGTVLVILAGPERGNVFKLLGAALALSFAGWRLIRRRTQGKR